MGQAAGNITQRSRYASQSGSVRLNGFNASSTFKIIVSLIQIFIGSPRKKGNTFYLAQKLTNGLSEKFLSEINFLGNLKINPCFDCRNCKKGDLVCTVNDDMHALYEKMEQSDILIFGTPIYWFGPSY